MSKQKYIQNYLNEVLMNPEMSNQDCMDMFYDLRLMLMEAMVPMTDEEEITVHLECLALIQLEELFIIKLMMENRDD